MSTRIAGSIGRNSGIWSLLFAILAVSGCTATAAEPAGAPVADPAALAEELAAATTPESPRQATFSWTLDEAGSRVSGRGVIRYHAPERIRLDLFGPRGETYLIAALVGDEFRLPPTAREFELPPPALLWGALGVFRPDADAVLEGATIRDDTAVLEYVSPTGHRHRFTATGTRLVAVERFSPSGVLEESVRPAYSDAGEIARATYVDRRTFRELVLETESNRAVESFPETIWNPGVAGSP